MPSPGQRSVTVLGTGFAAFNLVKNLSAAYTITVVSPRNHFLFTPLLPSTTVGTIEFRSIIEPIRHARKDIRFLHAAAISLDTGNRTMRCKGASDGREFTLPYDTLVIAVGAISNTFNVPGVAEHAMFLKELNDARELRQRIIQSFEMANLPSTTAEERHRLLHFVVCGGGPTGVEFAAELNDFMIDDLSKWYTQLVAEARITLVEAANEILNTFDEKLRRYATDLFRRERISILTGSPVVRVEPKVIRLADGSSIPYGLLLWSTGNAATPFGATVTLPKDKQSRIIVDEYFHVKGFEDIYALGDCSLVERSPLPATSQVAQQQGKYLATALNRRLRDLPQEPFEYKHLGMLAYVGDNKALADLQNFKGRGWATWLFWRSAYLSKIVSLKNKFSVLTDWIKAKIFGRDISQF
jgi:NADH:ubiquinone reductase (non-electrogenic)